MFAKLFAESGLSLDRLRALLEVGAAGSIVKAVNGDPVRQSQYSRQIKELEEFFRTRLIERQGRGTRLTSEGKELARISRFFMLGLSNFQRGCLAEEQTVRIGASATFIRQFLLPLVAGPSRHQDGMACASEVVGDLEVERRLHDLTLDFGIVSKPTLSRPLQTRPLGEWTLQLWIPKSLHLSEPKAVLAFEQRQLPLALAKEMNDFAVITSPAARARLVCDSFLDARAALEGQEMAALLPSFLAPGKTSKSFLQVHVPEVDSRTFGFYLAWNPRLLRLDPHTGPRRDWLAGALVRQMAD